MSFQIFKTLAVKCLVLIAWCLVLSGIFIPTAAESTDSLIKRINSITDQRLLLSEYKKLVNLNLSKPDPNSLEIARKYTDLARKYGSDLDLADAHHCEGLINKVNENWISALASFLAEQALREKLSDSLGLAYTFYYLGDCNKAMFDPVPADEYLDKAFLLFEKIKDTAGLAKTLNRKAAVNIDSRNPARLETGYSQVIASNNLAEKIADYDLQVNNLLLMGSYFTLTNRTDQALTILDSAKTLLAKAKEKFHLALILSNIAVAHNKAGKYEEALVYGKMGYKDAIQSGNKVYQWLTAWNIFESYNFLKIEDSLYKYQAKSLLARLQVIDEIRNKQKISLERRFMKEKYELDLQSHKKQSRLILVIFLISLLSAVTMIALILIRNKRLHRMNTLLAEQNRIIEQQKIELTQLTRQKDKFYSIIAHDLRSPFNSILGFSEILTEELAEIGNPRLFKMAENLNQSAVKVFHLLENLLEWSKLQENTLNADPSNLPLLVLIKEILPAINDLAVRKEIRLTIDVKDSLYVFADKRMLSSVLSNLVWNALKFTPKKGNIIISASRVSDKMIAIQVKDSGIGMSANMVGSLFEFHASNNRPGTEGEPSSGLGLMISKEFVEQNGGRISVESEEGIGSIFTVTVPSN